MGLISEVVDEIWENEIKDILKGDDSDLTKLKKIGELVGLDYLQSEWLKQSTPTLPQKACGA